MTKNSTRKGLALGAIAALLASAFTSAPAYATGIDNGFVSLSPATGTEYTVIAGAGNSFKLTANNASTLTVGNLKFLVTDASGAIEPGISTSGRVGGAVTVSSTAVDATSTSVSFKSVPHSVLAGSLIRFQDAFTLSKSLPGFGNTQSYAVDAVNVASDKITILRTATAGTDATTSASTKFNVLREPRNTTTNTYVVDTGTRTTDSLLELVSDGETTRVVTVQAWVDTNLNGKIDTTEYVSPVRTVTFVKATELTVTSEMSIVPGDLSVSSTIKTTPVLNGAQALANNSAALNVKMTRQGSAVGLFSEGMTWNDTTKAFTGTVNLDGDGAVGWENYNSAGTVTTWSMNVPGNVTSGGSGAGTISAVTTTSKTVTLQTGAAHKYAVGDKITFGAGAGSDIASTQFTIASVPATDKITINTSTVSTAVGPRGAIVFDVTTYGTGNQKALVDRALPGTYTAQAFVNGVASGAKVTATATSATSADVQFNTVQSAAVEGRADGTQARVKKGTLTVPVEILVEDADEAAVSAGRPVVVSFTTNVLNAKVNDKTGAQTLTTDASGKVALTVTSPIGAVGSVTISATAENGPSQTFTLNWVDQAYGLVDLSGTATELADSTRAIVAGGSYTMELGVMDQWFAVASSTDYRLVVTGSGVVEGVKPLVEGKVSLTVTDNGFQPSMVSTVTLQKLTSGVWGAVAGKAVVLTTNVNKDTNSVILGAAGSTVFGSPAVDLSSPVASKALVAQDRRLTTTPQPSYSDSAVVRGKVQNAASSVGVVGAEVTITGPASVLFSNGSVDKLGSITVLSGTGGLFDVTLYSTTAQKDTVITVTSLGKSATTKVTFTGTTTGGAATSLVITAPDTVAPASTLQVKAKLADVFGNAVASAPVRVTYTGPGIAFGALPTAVDALGELSFSVLLGGGDTGTITVVVSYDQNGDGDYVDAKDLNTTKTITVGAAAVAAPSADQKVNAGSFKGFVAVYAKGYKGQRLSAKIGNDWVIVNSLASDFVRVTDFTGAGVAITVKIYIDRVEVASIPLTTK